MNSGPTVTSKSGNASGIQGVLVVQQVKEMITSGKLRPGDRLPVEKDLSEQLGVSRGSLREGVRALCLLGILETRQGDGTYVTALQAESLLAPVEFLVELQSLDSVTHLQAVRRVLETEAAAKAAQHIDDATLDRCEAVLASLEPSIFSTDSNLGTEELIEADMQFHRLIAEASGNPTLAALIDVLSSRTARARAWRAGSDIGASEQSHLEHRSILKALRARETDHARTFMANHLLRVEMFMQEHHEADQ